MRDYTGYKWAQHALSGQWLQFDDIFLEQKAAQMQQREAGYAVKDLDPGKVFISAVDEGDANKDPFAKAIKSQTLTFDEEGITVTGNQWEDYVGALENYVVTTNMDPALEGPRSEVMSTLPSSTTWDGYESRRSAPRRTAEGSLGTHCSNQLRSTPRRLRISIAWERTW